MPTNKGKKTLLIDDDIHRTVKSMASSEGKSLTEWANDFIRKALKDIKPAKTVNVEK